MTLGLCGRRSARGDDALAERGLTGTFEFVEGVGAPGEGQEERLGGACYLGAVAVLPVEVGGDEAESVRVVLRGKDGGFEGDLQGLE